MTHRQTLRSCAQGFIYWKLLSVSLELCSDIPRVQAEAGAAFAQLIREGAGKPLIKAQTEINEVFHAGWGDYLAALALRVCFGESFSSEEGSKAGILIRDFDKGL